MANRDQDQPSEVELKLSFPPEAREQIDRHPALQAPAETQLQYTTYFDTPDLALAADGLSLRVRHNGDQRMQTLKSVGTGHGVASHRGEWEWPIETDRPDLALLAGAQTGAALGAGMAAKLQPVVVTDIRRTLRRLQLDGGTTVEAAIDEGTIQGGAAHEPVHELELELKQGPIGPLYRLAVTLHAELKLRIASESKAQRGYRLLTGALPSAQKAREPKLDSHVGAADGFRQVIAASLGSLLGNQPAASAGDAEGVHQMRVAIRRLRAALLLFRPHLEPHATARFQAELRRLGGILGEARDWDVFRLETLVGADDGKPDADWKHLLQDAAEQAGTRAHAKVRDELAQPALTGLVLALAAWSESDSFASGDAGMQGQLSDIAPALLDRVARKVDQRGRRIGRLSEAELHALRKALKKLRYSIDDLSGLYAAKPVKSYLKHCKRLQEQLGTINDAVVAAALADRLTQDGHIDLVPAASTLALWAQENRAKALRRLPEAWDDFHAEARFWE